MSFWRAVAALILALLLLPADADARRKRGEPLEEPAIVRQALALSAEDRLAAIAMLEQYLVDGETPELMPAVRLHAGEQRRLAGDAATARDHFEVLVREHESSEWRDAGVLGIALLNHAIAPNANTLGTLDLVNPAGVPDTMNADRHRILALETEGDVREHARKALAYAQADPVVASRVRRSLAHLLSEQQLASSASEGDPDASTEEAAIDRARAALAARDFGRAQELAHALLEMFPDSAHGVEADWILRRATVNDPYSPRKVGVLLPLTGTYGPSGGQLRDAIELAVEGSGTVLVFRDTEGAVEPARAAFEELVLDEGVAAVMGPLLSEVAVALADDAQAAGVPMLSLSKAPHLTEDRDHVFRGMLTVEQQVDALLDYTLGELGLQKYAILAPDSSYGTSARDAFHEAAVERGAEITDVVLYDPAATDFRDAAQKLGEKDYEARKNELWRLRKEAEESHFDAAKVVLPPIMDFEAIFVPDGHRRVSLVAGSLAYEEFAIGSFTPKLAVDPVPLLGLNGWHNPELAKTGGKYLVDGYFVNNFDPWAESPEDPFRATYRGVYDRSPGILEAAAYDAARLIATVARNEPPDREAWREALAGAHVSAPVAGGGQFDDERQVDWRLTVFTVVNESTQTVSGAERAIRPVEPEEPADATP